MQLGISTYTYTWAVGVPGFPPDARLQPTDLLDKAASLGVRVLQLADNLPLHALPTADLEDLASRARGLGIAIEVGTRGIGRDHLREYLHLAVYLGSPILRVVVDSVGHHPSAEEVVERIGSFVPELRRSGVVLAIENHDRFPTRTLVRILQQIDSDYVGVCLDTVNSLGALEGPEIVVDTLAPWVVNLHIKDFVITRVSHMMGFVVSGRPAGQGQLDVPWLLRRIAEAGRDPNAILELWTPPEDTVGKTIAKEDSWAAASIAYLRQLIPG